MLKIKDNVDLKELEKYGFSSQKDTYNYDWNYAFNWTKIIIQKDTRLIEIESYAHIISHINILFDLIKDGLVEKVEGE